MSALRAVEFKKGRGHAPRLSPPRQRLHGTGRVWTDEEREIVRRYFPDGGAPACEAHLPRRDRAGIYTQAYKMGIRVRGSGARRKPMPVAVVAEIDDRIREEWPLLPAKKRGAVKALAARLGVPSWWLSHRAVKLGLTIPHEKSPPWTDAEVALLGKVPLHRPDRCAKIFREHGFNRSATAICMKCRMLSLSRRYRETLSARAAARILGVDDKTMTLACIAGEIKAARRGTKRAPQQGNDAWSIEPADLRRYVLDTIERIDLRKVDKLAFVQLIAQEPLA